MRSREQATDTSQPIRIDAGGSSLNADLILPERARGIVVFVHGSGSGRFSRRNREVADSLSGAHLASLMLDLLTPEEERTDVITTEFRFDIPLLASRTTAAIDWTSGVLETRALPLGLFGGSTGAAAALIAASERPGRVEAIVSRGGRPDLAEDALGRVTTPTLLIVGGRDEVVLDLNSHALEALAGPKALRVVPGATHLFEEKGALALVSDLATDWFLAHFSLSPQ